MSMTPLMIAAEGIYSSVAKELAFPVMGWQSNSPSLEKFFKDREHLSLEKSVAELIDIQLQKQLKALANKLKLEVVGSGNRFVDASELVFQTLSHFEPGFEEVKLCLYYEPDFMVFDLPFSVTQALRNLH